MRRAGASAVFAAAILSVALWALPRDTNAQQKPAQQMTAQQVGARIAKQYNVRVLKVRSGTVAGRPAFLLTVMNRGGAYNEAFQVNTLAADARTGRLLPALRHGHSRLIDGDAPTMSTNRQPTDGLSRGFLWR